MSGLLDSGTIDLAQATSQVRELSWRRRGLRYMGMALTVAGIVLLVSHRQDVGIALLIGAGAAFVLSSIAASDRHRLLIQLILEGDAVMIDGVPQLAERLCRNRERRRLAAGLRAAASVRRPGIQSVLMVDPARASDVAERLAVLASAIGNPATRMSSTAIALGHALLIDPMRSPLYNPNLPERDLTRVLDMIEREIE